MSLIEIRSLTFAYPGSFDNVFEGLNLQLDTTWRLGLVGRNGRGKTTLLRLLAGGIAQYTGSISVPVELDCFPPAAVHPGAGRPATVPPWRNWNPVWRSGACARNWPPWRWTRACWTVPSPP